MMAATHDDMLTLKVIAVAKPGATVSLAPEWRPQQMPRVTYIEYSGSEHQVEVPVGLSVMRGAVTNNVPGIDADCGGECACATCHVYVDPEWLDRTGLPEPGSQEASMLSFAAAAEPNSRLSCQITMCEELHGLVVRMPEGQH